MLDSGRFVSLAKSQHHKTYKQRLWTVDDLYSISHLDFDCSSLVMWLYFTLGFKLPRVSQWQYNYCDRFMGDPKIGDLFFLAESRSRKKVNHVGAYIGKGMCIEAAGGRANKVIYSIRDVIQKKKTFLSWRRVPLDRAEDMFFRFIKDYPATGRRLNENLLS